MHATHLHFDCFSGMSGDMTLGALVDLGCPLGAIESALAKLPIGPFALKAEKAKRAGIVGTKVHVEVEEEHHVHRHLRHILEFLQAAELSPAATRRAERAYRLIAEAEAIAHDSTPEKIHFHEVGAKDAVIDVAGAMVGFEELGIESFSSGPIYVGAGFVECAHGTMPVPAPATAEILRQLPTRSGPVEFELVTPTGAAILHTVLEEQGLEAALAINKDSLRVEKIGYGAGNKSFDRHPNLLRLMLCQSPATSKPLPLERDQVLVLGCEIDDMSPEWAGHLMERLFALGALDVQFSSVQMKKQRPGLAVQVIAREADEAALVEALMHESSTFGVRRNVCERHKLRRESARFETPMGAVAVKIGYWGDTILKVSAEHEDLKKLASESGRPLPEVSAKVQALIQERYGIA